MRREGPGLARVLAASWGGAALERRWGGAAALCGLRATRAHTAAHSPIKTHRPYRYGHVTEVSVQEDGSSKATKWYTMGRAAVELA